MAAPSDVQLQELLAQRDFVRALAVRLVGVDAAEDLQQDAWLAALARGGEVRSARKWLGRVVERLAQNRRRGEARRRRRDGVFAARQSQAGPSTDEVLACEDVRRRIVAAVLELPEPFRRTVLARYYEGLDARDVAARDGVALATVRSRLKRAHDQLRARLDREHGGGRAAWAGPVALLLGREQVLLGGTMATKKAIGIVAVAVLLCAFVGWRLWFVDAGVAPPERLVAPAVARGGAKAGADSPIERIDAVVSFAEPRGSSGELDDANTREALVRVLDRANGQPVAGAEVRFERRERAWHVVTRDRVVQERSFSSRWLEEHGACVRTDANGLATVEVPAGGSPVFARAGARVGRARLSAEELRPGAVTPVWVDVGCELQVRLVDGDGAPVAGELLEVFCAAARPMFGADLGSVRLAGPSDAHGLVTVYLGDHNRRIRVRPWVTGVDDAWQSIDPAAVSGEPVQVRCPRTGSMTIELCAPSGERLPLVLSMWGTDVEPLLPGRRSMDKNGPVMWRNAELGLYEVAHLAVGQAFHVVASATNDVEQLVFERDVAGPMAAGEDVRVRFVAALTPSIVRVRLCEVGGAALPESAFATAKVVVDGRSYAAIQSGGVSVREGVSWLVPTGRRVAGTIRLGNVGHGYHTVAWSLPEPARPGVQDLGVLEVERRAVAVAGRIDAGASVVPGLPVEIALEVELDNGRWQGIDRAKVDVARDAGFELREPAWPLPGRPREETRPDVTGRSRRLVITASRGALPAAPVPVSVGDRDVVVPLSRGGGMRARVLADAAYAQMLRLRCVRRDGGALPAADADHADVSRADAELTDFDGDVATFAWPALPPGRYDVEVRVPTAANALLVVRDVEVREGCMADDERLSAIDVREAGQVLTVVLPPGTPGAAAAGAAVRATGSDGDWAGLAFDRSGRSTLLVVRGPQDLLVGVPGHRLWRASGVTAGVVEVTLEPPLEVPVRLTPRLAEALRGLPVTIRLRPRPAEGGEPSMLDLWRPGHAEPAVQVGLPYLQVLEGMGEVRLSDASKADARLPLAATGRFEVELLVHCADRTEVITENTLFLPFDHAVAPHIVEVGPSLDAVEIGVSDKALPILLERVRR